MSTEAYIFEAIRTPRGRGKPDGGLHGVIPLELLANLFTEMQQRTRLDTSQVDDIMLGCVTPVGEQGADIARNAPIYAGWHVDTPGMQINRWCASGLETVNTAAMKVRSGWESLVVAGGVEAMSRVPMASDGGFDGVGEKARDVLAFVPQGISADLIATLEGFGREDLDYLAYCSQMRASHARENGYFRSLVPVRDEAGDVILAHDEHIRPETTLEGLAALVPAFEKIGRSGLDALAQKKYPQADPIRHLHTAGNSSGIVDGAALVLVGSASKGRALGLKPRARVLATALVGTEPTIMLIGPAPATQKALRISGMAFADIDLIEINEAFASVVLKFMRDMGCDDFDRINVNGGAIALGHPLGSTGSMLLGTLLDELERRDLQTGLVTLCAGGGMGIATIVERV